jgi:hypothetical protein
MEGNLRARVDALNITIFGNLFDVSLPHSKYSLQ